MKPILLGEVRRFQMKRFFVLEKEDFGSYISSKWVLDGEEKKLVSPTTGKEWGKLHLATDHTIQQAIDSVKDNPIIALPPYERAEILWEIKKEILANQEELSKCITLEMGKPINDAIGEIIYTANYFGWFAEEVKRIYGKEIPSAKGNKKVELRYEPIGPCGFITPWNFPIAMAGRKIAAALAAGCPVIVKPSSFTPISLLLFATLCFKETLPPYSLHILVGDSGKIGKALMDAPHIRKLSFTGSYETGKELYIQGAHTLKKATLELGGNAPLIVFDDANLESAVEGAIAAKFRMSGQTCVCANRLFVHKKILPDFLPLFIKGVKALKVGDPFQSETQLSHTLHPQSIQKARAHIENAVENGAQAHLGAKEGFEPEILTGVTPNMRIFNEETFGPVAPIITFEDEKEVIELANATPYGLASYFFTEGLKRAERIASALRFGIVGLNDGLPSAVEASFGGIKDSGFGREGGPTGIYEYLTEKLISQTL